MAVFFLSALIVATIAGTVFLLRQQQRKANAEYAERHRPLPPLIPSEVNVTDPASDSPDDAPPGLSEQSGDIADILPDQELAEAELPVDWLMQCRRLRNEGHLDEALTLCLNARPQLQALEQQAMVYRARLRESRRQGDREAVRQWLDALYLVAAQASCLHDAPSDDRHPRQARRLARTMSESALRELSMPYREIGHEKLKLLRKTDRQLLESEYGPPHRHISAREWHDRQGRDGT